MGIKVNVKNRLTVLLLIILCGVFMLSGCMLTEKSQQRNFSEWLRNTLEILENQDACYQIEVYHYRSKTSEKMIYDGLKLKTERFDEETNCRVESGWITWSDDKVKFYFPHDENIKVYTHQADKPLYYEIRQAFPYNVLNLFQENANWFSYRKNEKKFVYTGGHYEEINDILKRQPSENTDEDFEIEISFDNGKIFSISIILESDEMDNEKYTFSYENIGVELPDRVDEEEPLPNFPIKPPIKPIPTPVDKFN